MTRHVQTRRVDHADCHEAMYECGHIYRIPNSLIVKHRGIMNPPVCPACHGQAAIDKMEADNWRQDNRWPGFTPGVTQQGDPKVSAALKRAMAQEAVRTGLIGQVYGQWLDKQLNMTISRAWH